MSSLSKWLMIICNSTSDAILSWANVQSSNTLIQSSACYDLCLCNDNNATHWCLSVDIMKCWVSVCVIKWCCVIRNDNVSSYSTWWWIIMWAGTCWLCLVNLKTDSQRTCPSSTWRRWCSPSTPSISNAMYTGDMTVCLCV